MPWEGWCLIFPTSTSVILHATKELCGSACLPAGLLLKSPSHILRKESFYQEALHFAPQVWAFIIALNGTDHSDVAAMCWQLNLAPV